MAKELPLADMSQFGGGGGLPLADMSQFEPAKPSGAIRRLADTGISLAKGIVGLPEAAVGVADLVTGGRAGKLVQNAGVRFKDAKDIMSEYYSPEQKAANAEVDQAQGFIPTLGAMVSNPSTIVNSAVESAPSMIGGGAVARGALKLAPTMSPIMAGALGEGVTAAGQNAEQVRQEDPNGLLTGKQSAILGASGALTGGISLASGKLANKLGIGHIQTMLASGKLGPVGAEAGQKAASKGAIRKIAEGFGTEGVLQELPQSYQEQVAQNLAQGKPWDEGASKAGAQGLLTGGLMGSAGSAAGHFAKAPDVHDSTQDASAPAAEVPIQTPVDVPREAPTRTEAMGINPQAGPIQAAAAIAVEGGVHDLANAAQQVAQQAAIAPSDGVEQKPTASKEIAVQDQSTRSSAVLPASVNQETGEITSAYDRREADRPRALPTDFPDVDGNPAIYNFMQAKQAANAAGEGYAPFRLDKGKYVVRKQEDANGPLDGVQPLSSADSGPGRADGVPGVVSGNPDGLGRKAKQSGPVTDNLVQSGELPGAVLANALTANSDQAPPGIAQVEPGTQPAKTVEPSPVPEVSQEQASAATRRATSSAQELRPENLPSSNNTPAAAQPQAGPGFDANSVKSIDFPAAPSDGVVESLKTADPSVQRPNAIRATKEKRDKVEQDKKATWLKAINDQNRLAGDTGVQLSVAPNGKLTFLGVPNATKQGRALAATFDEAVNAGATHAEIIASIKAAKSQPQEKANGPQANQAQQASAQRPQAPAESVAQPAERSTVPTPAKATQPSAGEVVATEEPRVIPRAVPAGSKGDDLLRSMPINTRDSARIFVVAYKDWLAANNPYGRVKSIHEKPASVRAPDIAQKAFEAVDRAELNYWQMPYENAKKRQEFYNLPLKKWEDERTRRGLSIGEPAANAPVANADQAARAPEPVTEVRPGLAKMQAAKAAKEAAPQKASLRERAKQSQAARADYFTPGNIVTGYSGHDRVIAYTPPGEDGSGWSVKVQSVIKQDGQWVPDPKDNRERLHSTPPEAANLAKGPVERAPLPAAQADKQNSTPSASAGQSAKEFTGKKRGDFYEIEGDNAKEAARILGLTLTKTREGAPSVGWPYYAHEQMVRGLANAGFDFKDAEPAPDKAASAPEPVTQARAGLAKMQAARAARQAAAAPADRPTGSPSASAGHMGRDNQPLEDGGKPFKTNLAAKQAKQQQPMLRVLQTKDGYVLAPKTEKQIAAQEKAARRLANATPGQAGVPTAAHQFIAGAGGLHASQKNEFGFGGNPRVGNKFLFSPRGLSMEEATMRLTEAGYLPENASHTDAINLIERSFKTPQYTPDGTEQMAKAEQDQRFEDHLAAQQEAAHNEDFDPFESLAELGIEHDSAEAAGYDAAADPIKLEVNALLAQAKDMGLDVDHLQEQAYEDTRNGSEQDYLEAARDAIKAAVKRGHGNRSEDSGAPGHEGRQEGLTSPTRNEARKISWFDGVEQRTAIPYGESGQYIVKGRKEMVDGIDGVDTLADKAQLDALIKSESQPPTLDLEAPTPQSLQDRENRKIAADKSAKAQEKAQAEIARRERERKDIAARSVGAAGSFELGGDANQNLSGQEPMFSRTEPFYSALAKEVASIPAKAQSAMGWQANILGLVKSGKVKQDEIEWSGITDFLKLQTGKVTKEQVTAFLDANGVQVSETVLGKKPVLDTIAKDMGFGGWSSDLTPEQEQAVIEESKKYDHLGDNTKYSKYQLPGGTHYREVLLTLPPDADHLKAVADFERQEADTRATIVALRSRANQIKTDSQENAASKWQQRRDAFVSSRFNEAVAQKAAADMRRAGPGSSLTIEHYKNNSRVLLTGSQEYSARRKAWIDNFENENSKDVAASQARALAEKESYEANARASMLQQRLDRSVKPIAQGYKSSHWDQKNVLAHIRLNDRTDADGKKVLFVEELQSDASQDRRAGKAVPDMPFTQKTDAWVSLAIKRVIKLAVDGGYAKVAFVNGAQSAERYDLSKQVKEIVISKYGDDKFNMQVDGLNGEKVFDESSINSQRLEEVVGKEIAKKATALRTNETTVLKGDGLKVGGEGMKAFYDKIVPSVTKDVLRRLGVTPHPLGKQPGASNVIADGLPAYAKFFSDLVGTHAFVKKGFDGLNASDRRVVMSHMLSIGKDNQILNAVIAFVQIDVVNVLRREQLSANSFFHNPSMMADRAGAIKTGNDIPALGDVASSMVSAVAKFAAKRVAGLVNERGIPGETATAMQAQERGTGNAGFVAGSGAENIARATNLGGRSVEFDAAIGAGASGHDASKVGYSPPILTGYLQPVKLSTGQTQPGFTITDAMREKAADGLPLFAKTALPASQSTNTATVQKTVDSITANWTNAPPIIVAFDLQDPRIPERVRQEDLKQRSGGAAGTPEGFFYKGSVYLMSSKLTTPNDVARVLAHEALGHYGLRGLFGDALKPILREISVLRKADVRAKAIEYGLRNVTELDQLTAAEEVLAEMAQTNPKSGFVRRAIAAIRTWLRKNVPGFKSIGLTDDEIIRSYLLPARGWVERGQTSSKAVSTPSFNRGKNEPVTNPKDVVGNQQASPADGSKQGPPIGKAILAAIFNEDQWLDRGLKIGAKAKLYRGEDQNTGKRNPNEGRGLYITTDRQQAEGYGKVREIQHSDLPKNPLRFRDVMTFDEWQRFAKKALGNPKWITDAYPDDWIRRLDSSVDGIQIGTGHGAFFVKFPPMQNQFAEPRNMAANQGGRSADDYQPGTHRPASPAYGSRADDLSPAFGDDIYAPNAAQIHGQNIDADKQAIAAIRAMQGKPEAQITVFRAVPEDRPDQIGAGDWVTTTRAYAKLHGEAILGDDFKIIRKIVPAGSLFNSGDSIHEFGYHPNEPTAPDSGGAPAFSRSMGETLSAAANSVKDVKLPAGYLVGDLINSAPGKINWWHKTIGTQYNLAQRSKPFKRVFDSVQNFINDVSFYATEAADLAPNILPKLETWKDIAKAPLSAQDTKAISAPIFEGTLTWGRDESGKPVKMAELEAQAVGLSVEKKAQRLMRNQHITEQVLKMWQGLPVEQFESIINGKYERDMLNAGVVWTPAELKAIFGLTDKQIGLYHEFRTATDKSLTNLAVSDMLRYGGNDVSAVRDKALNAPTADKAAGILADHLRELAELIPERNAVLLDTADRMIEKGDRAIDLIQRGYAPLSRFGQYTLDVVHDGERVYFGMFENKFDAARMAREMDKQFPGAQITRGTVSEQAYKMFAGVSPETLELFGNMLGLEAQGDTAAAQAFQTYLKLAKSNRSSMKRLIERKGISGFSEDSGRVLAGFVYSNARQTASNLHMGEMTQAAADNEAFGRQGELQDQAVKLVDYIKNPQEEAQSVRGLLFAQYIGGSVASAMVNLTQPLTMTFPWLSQYGGMAKAAKQMMAATRDALKKTTGDKALDAALHRAEEDGTVSPQEVHQLMQQSMGKGVLRSGDGTKAGDAMALAQNAKSRVSLAWGKLFSAAEQFNRRSTFIAAYRTAIAEGMPDPDAFARKAIAETQGVYNKGNKPAWARGALGSTLFTFKQFSISYVEMLSRMAKNGPEGKKAALLALGVLFLLSGAGGLPGADDLDDIISGAMQALGYNFDSKSKRREFFAGILGEGGAQFMERGISGLPGAPIDVSGRMGLGNLIPGTGLLTKKTDHTSDVAEIAGPAGDLAKRTFTAAGQLVRGEVGSAANSVSPTAIQNFTKAYDMANMGIYRDQTGKKVIDTDASDAIAKAIGFQPNDVKKVQDATREAQRMIGLNKMRETEIADQWGLGLFEKDPAKVQAARDDLAKWNADNPESPIRIGLGQIVKRVKAMNQTKEERLIKTTPREIRNTVRQELLAAR